MVAVRVSRQSGEVFSETAEVSSVTRVDVEVAAEAEAANAVDPVRVSRQSAEVLISISPRAALTRVDVEVAAEAETSNAVDPLRVSRQSAEVLARRGSAGAVAPLALSDDAELFLHDWADAVALRSSYLTDVTIAETGAEARLGLRLKPARSMDVVWRQTRDEFDANDLSRLDRLYVWLRRITDARFQVPLYPDMRRLDAVYGLLDDELLFDTSKGRWFVGARVAIVQVNMRGSYASHSYHLIQAVQADRLVLTAALGIEVRANSIVVPMIDCEIALEADVLQEAACLAEVTVTVDEVPGASQLPGVKSDTPTGTPTHNGIPILDVDPNWTEGVRRGRSRQGVEFTSGRARGVSALADRSRETHELNFLCQRGCSNDSRQDGFRLVEFFDTRRGRLRVFFHVDQEWVWECAQLQTGFVHVVPFGDFADFSEELQGGYVGLVMSDGSFYVRDAVTVQDLGVTWRMTVDPPLPMLDAADNIRVARARVVRFDSDELEERWSHAGLLEARLRIIEALEEKDVSL